MRKIVFLLMLVLSNFAYSQKDEMHRVYCELLGSSKFLSTKVTVYYMGRLGWKFEQAYVVTVGQQNVYHWLLSKEILENEAIKDGFETRRGYNETSKQ